MQQIDEVYFNSRGRGNLLPILHEIQNRYGYLPRESLEAVAGFLRLSDGTVYSIASSYPAFKFAPIGAPLRQRLPWHRLPRQRRPENPQRAGKTAGHQARPERPADLEYSLDTVACTGACSLAPVVIVDNEPHGEMTAQKVGGLLGDSLWRELKRRVPSFLPQHRLQLGRVATVARAAARRACPAGRPRYRHRFQRLPRLLPAGAHYRHRARRAVVHPCQAIGHPGYRPVAPAGRPTRRAPVLQRPRERQSSCPHYKDVDVFQKTAEVDPAQPGAHQSRAHRGLHRRSAAITPSKRL